MKKTREVELFDTSLRDGMQQPNIEISTANAVKFLQAASAFGVKYAEIGFSGAHQQVSDLTRALRSVDTGQMKLALFGRTRGCGVRVQDWPDLRFMMEHKDRIPVAVIVLKSRLMDVTRSLRITAKQNLLIARETIAYLQDNGFEVLVDFEHGVDAFCGRRECGRKAKSDFRKRSAEHLKALVAQSLQQQVSRLVICDTNGGADPEEISELMNCLTTEFPRGKFGFHGHTDRGLGIANSRAAILAGAMHVQGTLPGIGERCGNVNLVTLVGSMQLKHEAQFVSAKSLVGLTGLAELSYRAFGIEIPHSAPIVGAGAFTTWAGMHGSSENKNPGAYLWCDPKLIGAKPAVGVNRQSGTANIRMLSKQLGVELNLEQAKTFMTANQATIEGGGYEASHLSFQLACMRLIGTLPEQFSVPEWNETSGVSNGIHSSDACMALMGNGQAAITTGKGAGPVDSLTNALRAKLVEWFPTVSKIRLDAFSVRAMDVMANDTASKVLVTVRFEAEDHEPWTTSGVSSDLNQAALLAIVDGIQYWLLQNPT